MRIIILKLLILVYIYENNIFLCTITRTIFISHANFNNFISPAEIFFSPHIFIRISGGYIYIYTLVSNFWNLNQCYLHSPWFGISLFYYFQFIALVVYFFMHIGNTIIQCLHGTPMIT